MRLFGRATRRHGDAATRRQAGLPNAASPRLPIPASFSRRRGVAACELAIVLPFLLFMTLIAVDYCRVFYHTQTLYSAARSGALVAGGAAYGSPNQSVTEAATAAALAETTNLQPPVQAGDVSVTIAADSATVTVTYRFQTLAPYPGIPATTDLRVKVVMPKAPQ